MEIWYCIDRWNSELVEMKVVRETKAFLIGEGGWQGERRIAKIGRFDKWFSTKQDAIFAERANIESDVRNSEYTLERYKAELAEFNQKYPEED